MTQKLFKEKQKKLQTEMELRRKAQEQKFHNLAKQIRQLKKKLKKQKKNGANREDE
jgi:hypothetical protein